MEKPRPSTIAWSVLAAGVVAYDLLSPKGETLSERLDEPLETCRGKATLYPIVGGVALHLLNLLPPRIDPIARLATELRREYE